jgi:hypothetical protein
VKVPASAPNHGALAEDAVQAADWCQWIEPLGEDDRPHRELRLGFDTQARLLETVVLVIESGEQMVIHAMPARRQYWDLLP